MRVVPVNAIAFELAVPPEQRQDAFTIEYVGWVGFGSDNL